MRMFRLALGANKEQAVGRNFLLILIGVLVIVAVGASYLYYQERQKSQSGIDIQIDEHGVKIEGH